MYRLVDGLQKKSDRQKRTILAGAMAVAVLVVGGLWATTLDKRFAQPDVFTAAIQDTEGQVAAVEQPDVEGPFASLGRSLGAGFASIKQQVSTLTTSVETEEERAAFPLPTDTQ